VQVIRVDLERRQIDLGLTEILDAVRATDRHRGARRGKTPANRDDRPGRGKRAGPRERSFRKATRRR
jgi:hypothetical protein